MLTGQPNPVLAAVLAGEINKALRSGVALENVIATLIRQAAVLQGAVPLVNAVLDSRRNPT
jgi:hypothetical protein